MNIIINKDHLVYSNLQGEYHISAELFVEKGADLEEFVIAEISKKASQNQYVKATINFKQARKLGFCEHGISNFCKQLGIDKSKTYSIAELQSKLTLKVMFDYSSEIVTLFGKDVFKGFETKIAGDVKYSYLYATNVLKSAFPQGEAAIAGDAWYSYYYAKDVLKGVFPQGEARIAGDACYSYNYAIDVLKGAFPQGEDAIAGNAEYSYFYARDVLKGAFPQGEAAIAGGVRYSYLYAIDVLKDAFPQGEAKIAGDAYYSYVYARDVLKGAFPQGEAKIAGDVYYSERYNKIPGVSLKKPGLLDRILKYIKRLFS